MTFTGAFVNNYAAKVGKTYGSIRFWGSIGIVLSSIILLFIKAIKHFGFLIPTLMTHLSISAIHSFVIFLWPDKSAFKISCKIAAVDNLKLSDFGGIEFKFAEKFIIGQKTVRNCRQDIQMVMCAGDMAVTGSDQKPLLLAYKFKKLNSFDSDDVEEGNMVINLEDDEVNENDPITIKPPYVKTFETYSDSDKPIGYSIYLKVILMIIKRNRHFLRFFIMFIIYGSITVTNWVYLFPHLKLVYKDDFMSVTTWLMFGRYGSETIFYYLSPFVTRHLSHSIIITSVMFANFIRYTAYSIIELRLPLFYIVSIETLAAPINGLFFCALNEVAMEFALKAKDCVPKLIEMNLIPNHEKSINRINDGFKATLVALSARCFDSFGFAIGSVTGGWLAGSYDYSVLWKTVSVISGLSGIVNLLFDLKNYINNNKNDLGKRFDSKSSSSSIDSRGSYESMRDNRI